MEVLTTNGITVSVQTQYLPAQLGEYAGAFGAAREAWITAVQQPPAAAF